MANVPSAAKRNRQRLKRRQRNLNHLTATRTLVKRAVTAAATAAKDPAGSTEAVAKAIKQLDRAAQKGVLKRKTASRKISRLTKALARHKPAAAPAK